MQVETLSVQSFLRWFERKLGFKVYIQVYSDGRGKVCKESGEEVISFTGAMDLYRKIREITESCPL
jgi:hypothetical protein